MLRFPLKRKYRLLTRSDFDGLVCAVLFRELNLVDRIEFAHPADMQHGRVPVTPNDISANLPFVEGVHLSFDHHLSEETRVGGAINYINRPKEASAARVVYNFFGGKIDLPGVPEELLAAVDKADSAQYTMDDILRPEGWALLSFIMDPHTGLGRFKDFRISNYQLMMDLITHLRRHSIDEILELPDVKERVDLYFRHQTIFRRQLRACTTAYDDVHVVDMRKQDTIYPGNRFMVYAIFPQCRVSIHILNGRREGRVTFCVGKSILNRGARVDIGALMLEQGGGGHAAAGECQIPSQQVDAVSSDLIRRISQAG